MTVTTTCIVCGDEIFVRGKTWFHQNARTPTGDPKDHQAAPTVYAVQSVQRKSAYGRRR